MFSYDCQSIVFTDEVFIARNKNNYEILINLVCKIKFVCFVVVLFFIKYYTVIK